MDIHKNARSVPSSRALLCRRVLEEGRSVRQAAEELGLSERRAREWLRRYQVEGGAGLQDRSCAPHRSPTKTPPPVVARIVHLRHQRWSCQAIAYEVGVSRATVARILARVGLSRLKYLEPKEPPRRYERQRPGELLHLDIKKLGRICGVGHRITGKRARSAKRGWEFVHVCVDDASRLAYVEVLGDEKATTARDFLQRAVAWYSSLGIGVQRVMTDNGACYISDAFRSLCGSLALRHLRTQPYRPRTNGKAERFIQTLLREWAYRFAYPTSLQRTARLAPYLHFYNYHRSHTSLARLPPISRLQRNNVLRLDN